MARALVTGILLVAVVGVLVPQAPAADAVIRTPSLAPSFNGVLRDPFWPVGYTPPDAREPEVEKVEASDSDALVFSNLSPEEQALVKSHLRVGGILHQEGKNLIAIINNQVTLQGDIIQLRIEQTTYRFRVKALTMRKIALEPAEPEETPPSS